MSLLGEQMWARQVTWLRHGFLLAAHGGAQ